MNDKFQKHKPGKRMPPKLVILFTGYNHGRKGFITMDEQDELQSPYISRYKCEYNRLTSLVRKELGIELASIHREIDHCEQELQLLSKDIVQLEEVVHGNTHNDTAAGRRQNSSQKKLESLYEKRNLINYNLISLKEKKRSNEFFADEIELELKHYFEKLLSVYRQGGAKFIPAKAKDVELDIETLAKRKYEEAYNSL